MVFSLDWTFGQWMAKKRHETYFLLNYYLPMVDNDRFNRSVKSRPSAASAWRTQVASDIVRNGLGVELLDGEDQVVAEVFRCDADHKVFFAQFVETIPLHAIEILIARAKDRLDPFEDGTPLASFNRDA